MRRTHGHTAVVYQQSVRGRFDGLCPDRKKRLGIFEICVASLRNHTTTFPRAITPQLPTKKGTDVTAIRLPRNHTTFPRVREVLRQATGQTELFPELRLDDAPGGLALRLAITSSQQKKGPT